jgi:hypothetical protein
MKRKIEQTNSSPRKTCYTYRVKNKFVIKGIVPFHIQFNVPTLFLK